MNPKLWMAVIVLLAWSRLPAEIIGDLVLKPDGCEKSGWCWCVNSLTFSDPHQVVWKTKDSLKTDGASIPKILQPMVGKPFDASYLKAAILHDHYCDRHVRPWRQTHRLFYNALLDQKLPRRKAKLMYFAVFWGGPKWVELIPGIGCGKNCIQRIPDKVGKGWEKEGAEWGFPVVKGAGFKKRAADYSSPRLKQELDELGSILEKNSDTLNLEELEKRVVERNPADFYFSHEDTVHISDFGLETILKAP